MLAAADERDEAEWIVRELRAPERRGRLALRRDGGALSHQRAVARAGGGVPPRGRAVSPGRRDQLLRAARGEGPAGLPPAGRQPGRRRGLPSRHRRAAPRPRRDQPRHARAYGRARGASRCSRPRASPTGVRRPPAQRAGGLSRLRRLHRRAGRRGRHGWRRPRSWSSWSAPSTTSRCCSPKGPKARERWENVRELVASAANWSEEVTDEAEGTPLERFLAEAALLASADTVVGREDGVTLMTLHTAKGLEWPVVVLDRPGAWALPARARRGAARRARGGASALLRRAHPSQGQALSELGAGAAARWRASAGNSLALSARPATRHHRGAPHDRRSGRRTGAPDGAGVAPDAGAGRWPSRRRRGTRMSRPPRRGRRAAARRGLAGRAALRERRAGAASPVRQRHHPGTRRAPGGTSRCRSRSTTPRSA